MQLKEPRPLAQSAQSPRASTDTYRSYLVLLAARWTTRQVAASSPAQGIRTQAPRFLNYLSKREGICTSMSHTKWRRGLTIPLHRSQASPPKSVEAGSVPSVPTRTRRHPIAAGTFPGPIPRLVSLTGSAWRCLPCALPLTLANPAPPSRSHPSRRRRPALPRQLRSVVPMRRRISLPR